MAKSSKSAPSRQSGKLTKPKKPTEGFPDGFPLTPHDSGKWCKKIRRKVHYFGKWAMRVDGRLVRVEGDGWQEAYEKYKEQAEDLHAGRTPRAKSDGLTVKDLCDRFFTVKKAACVAGEITARTLAEYDATAARVVKAFGRARLVDDLAADDFESLRASMADQFGPVRLSGEIGKVKMIFRYGYESHLIDKPVRYGQGFKPPKKRVLRKHRATNGGRMLEADEIRTLLDAAPIHLKAMILLGVNCGFGNHDCGTLPIGAVDLKDGWIDYARPKSGIPRRCPLWKETVAALKASLNDRTDPKQPEATDTFFVTKYGGCWAKDDTTANPVSHEFRKLLKDAGLYRKGLGFYSLRHTFRTVADSTRDFPACRLIMGHADGSIDDVYRERIDDARLQEVVGAVRSWLFAKKETSKRRPKVRTKRAGAGRQLRAVG